MGRVKYLYERLLEANGGMLPPEATIEDLHRMEDLRIFEWQSYEREQEKKRLQFTESEDSGETTKIEQVQEKFTSPEHKGKQHKDCQ
jgi:hypothetical protein